MSASWIERLDAFLDAASGPVGGEAIMCHLGSLTSRQLPTRRQVIARLRDRGWKSRRSQTGTIVWHAPPDVVPETWARQGEVSPGDILIADGGFDCIVEGARVEVERDLHGFGVDLWVACRCGKHMLDGQLDEEGRYVGFAKAVAQ